MSRGEKEAEKRTRIGFLKEGNAPRARKRHHIKEITHASRVRMDGAAAAAAAANVSNSLAEFAT